ncbi:MAG: LysM peptidoglycan-binding domain-containing protein [Planctomycetales bacterium]|nr:LysM peptidoglycan-binding domain-containing protein [Planctomycetales bacterium]
MTADAKIGLLLGLFFIVVIAFLVNGLPNFIRQNDSKPVDVAITTPKGTELIIDNRLTDTVHRLRPQTELRQTEPPQEVVVIDPLPQPAVPLAELPAVPQQPHAELQPVVQPQPVAQVPQTPIEPRPVQPAVRKSKTHVIQPGESLAAVAQKYYGKEDGNRRAVIQKLYEVNSKTLKSPDRVCVGDKLVIPPLDELLGTANAAAKAPQPSTTLLNKFSTFLKPVGKDDTKKMSEYVVREGDSLWSISQRTLGDGKRYAEIKQLNKDKIKSADDLTAGMTLKIPTR